MAPVPRPPASPPDGGITSDGGPLPPPGGWPNPAPAAPPPRSPNRVATAALVCGIVALVTGIIPLLVLIAIPTGIAALITGGMSLRYARGARRGRGLAIGGLVTGALGIVAVLGWAALVLSDEDFRAAATELLQHGVLLATGQTWANLAPGDCLEEILEANPLGTVDIEPCDKLHVFEVFGVYEYPEGASTYPGTEALTSTGADFCGGAAFTDYVGVDYQSSRYDARPLVPDERSWQQGPRRIVCLLYEPGPQRKIGTARLKGA